MRERKRKERKREREREYDFPSDERGMERICGERVREEREERERG